VFSLNLLWSGEIVVAVSANVSYAIDKLKSEFNKLYPDTREWQVILGSTGKLTAQIKNQAPYQILMGANMDYPNALYSEGFAITKPVVYAKGSLAYFEYKKERFFKGYKAFGESRKFKKNSSSQTKKQDIWNSYQRGSKYMQKSILI